MKKNMFNIINILLFWLLVTKFCKMKLTNIVSNPYFNVFTVYFSVYLNYLLIRPQLFVDLDNKNKRAQIVILHQVY